MKIIDAISETGVCEAYFDGYTVSVREDENEQMQDVYTLSIGKGGMPPHYQQDFKTVGDVEKELASTFLPANLEWEATEID